MSDLLWEWYNRKPQGSAIYMLPRSTKLVIQRKGNKLRFLEAQQTEWYHALQKTVCIDYITISAQ